MEPVQPHPTADLPNASHFDSTDFNPVAWLNSSLAPNTALPSLLDHLQDSIRDAHQTLDSSLNKAITSIPWVVRETDKVRQRANTLRAGVDGVGQRVEGVESGVASSVSTIAAADTIVRRVERTSDLLAQTVEAEKLLTRLDALLSSSAADGSDLVSAADVVSKLRTTLAPLKPIPELVDRLKQLDESDQRLEALAAPQLRRALESRGTAAAKNARIVFDHAGRDNAFQTQYVALRGEQIATMWKTAWEARDMVNEASTVVKAGRGDLASAGAESVLVGFYAELFELIRVEADWLKEAFPDLNDRLLPMLVHEAVSGLRDPLPVSNVYVSGGNDSVKDATNAGDRLFNVALSSVTAAGRICRLLLTEESANELDNNERADVIVEAVTALLQPFRAFWNSITQVTLRLSRAHAQEIQLSNVDEALSSTVRGHATGTRAKAAPIYTRKRPSLGDYAKDVESCSTEVTSILDNMLTSLNSRTCGVSVSTMKQAANTLASSVSDRLTRILHLPIGSSSEDEWSRISGGFRLLIAAGTLKRNWDARKESLFAVAVGTATPVLEIASVVQESPAKRIEQFLIQIGKSEQQEAAMAWELVRDSKLPERVVSAFESLDSGTSDFESFINLVHRVVYDTMFAGVKERFASFNAQELLSVDALDGDGNLHGFSSAPLGYATEVAEFLMTIIQQLEPFVPDEEESNFTAPTSPYAFCNSGSARKHASGASMIGNGASDDLDQECADNDALDEDGTTLPFASMWISALAIGTMELYVEKICNVPKMSDAGTKQLATDADYICNIIASLGVPPTSDMALTRKLLECNSDAAAIKTIAAQHPRAEHQKLIRKVAAVRGINAAI